MGIESTKTVKRSDAERMLSDKNVRVYSDESLDRLAVFLYENRDSIFVNYRVVEDDFVLDKWDEFTTSWEV